MSMDAVTKHALRQWARTTSGLLTPDTVCVRSAQVLEQLKRVDEFRQARRVFICLSFGNEVNTWPLLDELAHGPARQVCVPRVERDGVMHVHLYPCKLRTLGMGLRQPAPGEPEIPRDEVDAFIDVAIILGLAFERQRGYRLGQGKGYFDKFLTGKSFPTIGLSYECLLIDRLPKEPHDIPMRLIVTESQTYRYKPMRAAA